MHLVRDEDLSCELTLCAADRIDFAGGSVTVSLPGPRVPALLSVRHEGRRIGEIGFDGRCVSFSGETIGVLRSRGDGPNGSALRIDLGARATTAAVEALVENLVLADPSGLLAGRTAVVTLVDARGRATKAPFALAAPLPAPRPVGAAPRELGKDFLFADADADGFVFAARRGS